MEQVVAPVKNSRSYFLIGSEVFRNRDRSSESAICLPLSPICISLVYTFFIYFTFYLLFYIYTSVLLSIYGSRKACPLTLMNVISPFSPSPSQPSSPIETPSKTAGSAPRIFFAWLLLRHSRTWCSPTIRCSIYDDDERRRRRRRP